MKRTLMVAALLCTATGLALSKRPPSPQSQRIQATPCRRHPCPPAAKRLPRILANTNVNTTPENITARHPNRPCRLSDPLGRELPSISTGEAPTLSIHVGPSSFAYPGRNHPGQSDQLKAA